MTTGKVFDLLNRDFLEVLFGKAHLSEARVASFRGKPADGVWTAYRADTWADRLKPEANNYFAVSRMNSPTAKRQAENFAAAHVVVLDDVNKKSPLSSVMLPPTWVLETSHGNFQVGYRIYNPMGDETRAGAFEAVYQGLAAKGLTDASGTNLVRYVRLPTGSNGKTGVPWRCRLRVWKHDREYTLEEITEAFGLTPGNGPQGGISGGGLFTHAKRTQGGGAPEGVSEDWVLDALARAGQNPTKIKPGWWAITCPWVGDHTADGGEDTGSAVIIERTRRGYSCFHAHCRDKDISAIEDWLVEHHPKEVAEARREDVLREIATVSDDEIEEIARRWVPEKSMGVLDRVLADWVLVSPRDKWWSRARSMEVSYRGCDDTLRPLGIFRNADGKQINPTTWMTRQAALRRVKQLSYRPGVGFDLSPDEENLWRPHADLELLWSVAGPLSASERAQVEAHWTEPLVRRIFHEAWAADLILDWWADAVRQPSRKPGWAVLLSGGQGIGKDLTAKVLVETLWGSNAAMVSAERLAEAWGDWMFKQIILCSDFKHTTRGSTTPHDLYNKLKIAVDPSAPAETINRKYGGIVEARCWSRWWFTANEPSPLPLEQDDRRFFVWHSTAASMGPDEGRRIMDWARDGGALLIARWLWERAEGMDAARRQAVLGHAPSTQAKMDTVDDSRSPVERTIRELLDGWVGDLLLDEDLGRVLDRRRLWGHSRVVSRTMKEAGWTRWRGGSVDPNGGHLRIKDGRQRLWIKGPEGCLKSQLPADGVKKLLDQEARDRQSPRDEFAVTGGDAVPITPEEPEKGE